MSTDLREPSRLRAILSRFAHLQNVKFGQARKGTVQRAAVECAGRFWLDFETRRVVYGENGGIL